MIRWQAHVRGGGPGSSLVPIFLMKPFFTWQYVGCALVYVSAHEKEPLVRKAMKKRSPGSLSTGSGALPRVTWSTKTGVSTSLDKGRGWQFGEEELIWKREWSHHGIGDRVPSPTGHSLWGSEPQIPILHATPNSFHTTFHPLYKTSPNLWRTVYLLTSQENPDQLFSTTKAWLSNGMGSRHHVWTRLQENLSLA